MTPEGRVREALKKAVKQHGGEHRKLRWIGRSGAPDEMIFWSGGVHSFVECKRPGQKPEPHQDREHARLRAGGFRVDVVDSEEGAWALVAALAEQSRQVAT